jgi:hypothetical protein
MLPSRYRGDIGLGVPTAGVWMLWNAVREDGGCGRIGMLN